MKEWIKENKGLFWLLLTCLVFFCIFMGITWLFNEPNIIGDSAGAVNGLFSAFAFAGVIYAIFLQREELQLQRKELEMTREELKGQKMEFEAQNETLRRQRFENTFFQMLILQQEIINNLSVQLKNFEVARAFNNHEISGESKFSGRELFSILYEKAMTKYLGESGFINLFGGMRQAIKISDIMAYETSPIVDYFDHYFRHLYRIIKFIDESPLLPNSFEERYQYTSMVRAQLSRHEQVWLFYNCIAGNGIEKFKPLVEKYALLKNFRLDLLAREEHLELYATSAFCKTPPTE